MLPIHKLVWNEWLARHEKPQRVPEPSEAMEDPEQIRSYVKAYEWGGPTSALQAYHLQQLARMIRPGDVVLDLACGPGPLLLELAPLYPSCRFIGADLSQRMLQALREAAAAKGIRNIETVCEDIRELPSVPEGSVDMVITTSALHHLPDSESLAATFRRIDRVLKPDGGLYVFDFGLLKSRRVRQLLVEDVGRKAPPVTAVDYKHSLDAAFPIDEVAATVRREFRRPVTIRSSSLLDFFYFVSTGPRTSAAPGVLAYAEGSLEACPADVRMEHRMLGVLQRGR